ncbi:MAG: hypothetical protein LBI38_05585 [Oscillospiraceae bacterium]|jgi:tetratricopeptide (TPR) repeat protein|nr:hypothetical protein [Oscillospiraceae bacterium]
MEFVQAKCTACGANLEVDPSLEAANCQYCGAAYIVEKAINNYNIENAQINAQTVNVSVGENATKLKANAEKSFAAGQYKNAYLDFKKAIELNRTDYEAYWGIVRVHMAAFYVKISDVNHIAQSMNTKSVGRYYGFWDYSDEAIRTNSHEHVYIQNAYKSAVSYAPEEKANEYRKIVAKHNQPFIDSENEIKAKEKAKQREIERIAHIEMQKREAKRKVVRTIGVLLIIFWAVVLVGGFAGAFGDMNENKGFAIFGGLCGLAGLITTIRSFTMD